MKPGYYARHKKQDNRIYFEVMHDGYVYPGEIDSLDKLVTLFSCNKNVEKFVCEHKHPIYIPITEVYEKTGCFLPSKYFTSNNYEFRR